MAEKNSFIKTLWFSTFHYIKSISSNLISEWQALLLGIFFCAFIVLGWAAIGYAIRGQTLNWDLFLDRFGNTSLLIGIVLTAMGTHLSKQDKEKLLKVEEGREAIDQQQIAKLLRVASTFSTQGLILLLFGTVLLLAKSFIHH